MTGGPLLAASCTENSTQKHSLLAGALKAQSAGVSQSNLLQRAEVIS